MRAVQAAAAGPSGAAAAWPPSERVRLLRLLAELAADTAAVRRHIDGADVRRKDAKKQAGEIRAAARAREAAAAAAAAEAEAEAARAREKAVAEGGALGVLCVKAWGQSLGLCGSCMRLQESVSHRPSPDPVSMPLPSLPAHT